MIKAVNRLNVIASASVDRVRFNEPDPTDA
jgi:hypothetical protein